MGRGLVLWIAMLFFVLLIGLETTITRMRAELGPPINELGWVGPDTKIGWNWSTGTGAIRKTDERTFGRTSVVARFSAGICARVSGPAK